jgi:hypothetical protein
MSYDVREESVQDGARAPSGNRVSVYEAAEVLEAPPGEPAPPPRLPAGAQGDAVSRKESRWRRLFEE